MSANRCRRSCPAAAAAAGEPNVVKYPEPMFRVSFHEPELSITPGPPEQCLFNKFWQLLARFMNTGYDFWKKVYDDPYRWQLFKSIMLFTMGIKFSGDLFTYMNPAKSIHPVKCGTQHFKRHVNCAKLVNRKLY